LNSSSPARGGACPLPLLPLPDGPEAEDEW
jgi:hypothetical protein